MLYALEVPPAGGNTYFCNMYRAYELLPEALRRRIAGLTLKHDGTYNSGGYVRQGVTAVDDPVTSPGVYHPLVCTHPETGRRALYLGRRRNAYIGGLPLAESEALLDELWTYASRDDVTWYNQWQVGDVVLWDNRCTMHRRDPFDPESRRVLHRTQIKGETRPAACRGTRGARALVLPGGSGCCARLYLILFVDPREHVDRGAADEGGSASEQHATGAGVFGVCDSVRVVPIDRRMDRR